MFEARGSSAFEVSGEWADKKNWRPVLPPDIRVICRIRSGRRRRRRAVKNRKGENEILSLKEWQVPATNLPFAMEVIRTWCPCNFRVNSSPYFSAGCQSHVLLQIKKDNCSVHLSLAGACSPSVPLAVQIQIIPKLLLLQIVMLDKLINGNDCFPSKMKSETE